MLYSLPLSFLYQRDKEAVLLWIAGMIPQEILYTGYENLNNSLQRYITCQYPVLLEPARVISPFLFKASITRDRVRCDFPVFRINSAYVRRGSSRRRLSTVCSRAFMWSFILPFFWLDNGNLFLSSLEKAMEKAVSSFS